MSDKERLEIIKFLRNSEKTVAPGMQPSELISRKDVDWLINRVEELEKALDLTEWKYAGEKNLAEKLKAENERYKQAFEYIQRAIYTQHCTKNHKWNTEFEKGQINGLIQASNIVRKAIERTEEGK